MSAIRTTPSEVEGTLIPQGDVSSWKSCAKTNTGAEEEVVLPGYDAGINTPGIQHSREKLTVSARLLCKKLQEIQTWTTGTGTTQHQHQHQQFSSEKQLLISDEPSTSASTLILRNHNHRSMIGGMNGSNNSSIQTFHCRDETETWTYRCRCNFQIVRAGTASASASYRYAMRSMGQPVLLGTKNSFPIATRRIQTAMHEFMEHLNHSNNDDNNENENNNDDGGDSCSDLMGQNGHLTSCTFSSAWRDTPDADCVLTLHYDHPLDGNNNGNDDGNGDGNDGTPKRSWKRQASLLCRKLKLRQLNGRSKGTLLSVTGTENFLDNENGDDDGTEATIRDTIFLLQTNNCQDNTSGWEVRLDDKVVGALANTNSIVAIPVHYEKPETAFYHPNPNAMTTALAWMLNRLAFISLSSSSWSSSSTSPRVPQNQPQQQLHLLEMYCGCGAHTVALGRSGLVSKILAVELDPRLVRACEANVSRNSLQDLVKVKKGDAGRWAKEESRKRRSRRNRRDADRETNNNRENYYDVLLVDPPRQGLDEEVCKMAMMSIDGEVGIGETNSEGCFRNLLYVSCGHQALLRDLERLSPVYEVVNCAQMDLFPRTDSIETLVHLRRRVEDKT